MNDETFLQTILNGIVLHPEQMRIDRSEDSRGILLRLHVCKNDMPFVIGRAGQSIAAIRLIMKIFAKDGPDISLILEEPS